MNKFLLGVIVGILLAPRPGKEVRDDIKDRSLEVIKKLKNIDSDELKKEITSKFVEMKNDVKDLDAQKAKELLMEKSLEVKEWFDDTIENIKDNEELKKSLINARDSFIGLSENALKKTLDFMESKNKEDKDA